ncbi:hypothetical protein ACHQM5_019338 [Ranunculus cassubicifolius]
MERIYVTVRPRPLSSDDAKSSPWKISGNSIAISNQSTRFDFDRIFEEDCKTEEVYKARTKDIVAAAVRGFNGTVFAYGQTNSGKTHTMRGSDVEPGVIRLSVHDLFDIIQEDAEREFLLRMSYMEIYNEEINDLLAPEHRKLQIHENIERGIFVAGLKEEIVAAPEQVISLMEFGESHRHIGETNMNLYSSRSHTIFRMIIESRIRNEDDTVGTTCDAVRVSVLNLVDLAGSERAAKTGAEGMRLKEGSHINKSLMTLGTVIKKLSEGVESNGGHVPYRDSKLTRILQPSLGGNANTAIICNITLAQVHADETKSSLMFASRALRVTNCAHVNEILTDAALLKRQKKEIEELRARLQGAHSEHFEEEILNLRNTLLQSELERERIALELQEEKKAQALRDRRLQEQAKQIENLSSMVLNSSVDEKRVTHKKDKRRETWCPSVISREVTQVTSNTHTEAFGGESIRRERNMGLPLPFEELVTRTEPIKNENPQDNCTPDKDVSDQVSEECFPNASLLLNVTNRRKAHVKKKNSLEDEYDGMLSESEEAPVEYENQNITKEIKVERLTKDSDEGEHHSLNGHNSSLINECTSHGDRSLTARESEAIIVIKQLQQQVMMLESEKSSIQQKLDDVIKLATEQKISAGDKYNEICQELATARKDASVAHEELSLRPCLETIQEDDVDFEAELLLEVEELASEVECSRNAVGIVSSIVDEVFNNFAVLSGMFLDLKSCSSESSENLKSIIDNHEKIYTFMEKKIAEVETQKSAMYEQSVDLHKKIQELQLSLEESERVLVEHRQQQDSEKVEYLQHIENLEKEILSLSSGALAKEKEALRKELDKTKSKLKETDFKLKNAVQEKTKLEGEKAQAEREIKRLHGQKTLLERDICRRDSIVGKKFDPTADRRRESKACDANKAKVHANEQMQKLEVLAFEMETTIASLEDQLAAVSEEKEDAIYEKETLALELEEKISELKTTQEEVSHTRKMLTDLESSCQKLEGSIVSLQEEKDQLAIQLTDALLELEEEKAIFSMKEKASNESIADITKSSSAERALLSKELSEVRHELESCREECEVLREKLILSEEGTECARKHSEEKASEIDQLRRNLELSERERENGQNVRFELESCKEESKLLMERLILSEKNAEQQRKYSEEKSLHIDQLRHERESGSGENVMLELETCKDECRILTEKLILSEENAGRQRKCSQEKCLEMDQLQVYCQNEKTMNMNEKAKLRMRLRTTQMKLDTFRGRYNELVSDSNLMDSKFNEASTMLKDKLRSARDDNLELARRLAEKESR